MQKLSNIDEELFFKVEEVKKLAKEMNFNRVCEFNLTTLGLNNIPWTDLNYPGVYFIEIKNCRLHDTFKSWADDFQTKWLDEKYRRRFVANPKKSRIEKHTNLSEWIPMYIGKSRNIAKRINEHINLGLEKPTFALKLACRDHLTNDSFRLSSIRVDVKNYDLILPIIERTLRDKINPIIGRQ